MEGKAIPESNRAIFYFSMYNKLKYMKKFGLTMHFDDIDSDVFDVLCMIESKIESNQEKRRKEDMQKAKKGRKR